MALRTTSPMIVTAALFGLLSAAVADDLLITSFSGNGEVAWTHPTNGVREYRIEWCANLEEGLWSDLECGLRGIAPTGGTMTAQVPMFYRIKALGPEPTNMVYIPAGWFNMGNCMSPDEGESRELPIHRVYVSAFYMDQYEVTKALWDEVYAWAETNGYAFDSTGDARAVDHPVYYVSWYDCVKWANARSEMQGLTPCYYLTPATTTVYRSGRAHLTNSCVRWEADGYRLPTEAEWEKAARGGASGHRFPWADDTISHGRANYRGDSPFYDYDQSFYFHPDYHSGSPPYTSPVGTFTPNGYGLYDMSGNLAEWCWDYYESTYYAISPDSDPHGPTGDGSSQRIVRNGHWGTYANACRVSYRGASHPDIDAIHQGFRLVKRAP